MNNYFNLIYSIVIFISSIIIFNSFLSQKKLFSSLAFVHERNVKQIKLFLNIHKYLMLLFTFTYISVLITFLIKSVFIHQILILLLLFFGSIYVFLSVILSTKIFNEIQKTIFGLLPICMHCKKIYDDKNESPTNNWTEIENYISNKVNARFSHSICPECLKKMYPAYATSVLNNIAKEK